MLHKKITMVNDCNSNWEDQNSYKNTPNQLGTALGNQKDSDERSVEDKKAIDRLRHELK